MTALTAAAAAVFSGRRVCSASNSCAAIATLLAVISPLYFGGLVSGAVERDDYQPAGQCITPGRCSSAPGEAGIGGVLLIQLLSGRDHSKPSRAGSAAERRLFEQAKGMMNYQYLLGDAKTREAFVVDGAWDPRGIAEFASEHRVKLRGYIATHFHYDHIGSVETRIPGL